MSDLQTGNNTTYKTVSPDLPPREQTAPGKVEDIVNNLLDKEREANVSTRVDAEFNKTVAGGVDMSILNQAYPTEEHVLEHDKFDAAAYDEMVKKSKELAKSIANGAKLHEPFEDLGMDIFNALFQYDPSMNPQGSVKRSHRLNHDLISRAMDTEQYRKLREHTKMDKLNSTLASVTISEELKKLLKTEFKDELNKGRDLQEIQKRLEESLKVAKDTQGVLDAIDQQGMQAPANLQQQLQQAKQSAAAYQQMMSQHANQIDQSVAGKMNKVRQGLRNAMDQAEQDVEAASGFGWGQGDGMPQTMSIEERIEIAHKMRTNDKLRAIAKLLGKMKRVAYHAQKNKVHTAKDEVHDIELGGEIARLVPSELVKFMHPSTKTAMMRSVIEKEALQYKLEGTENQGKGAIVCCVDISGSISFEEDVWQKAIALALLDIAHAQKRDFACILYDYSVRKVVTIPHKDPEVVQKVIEIGETYSGGGTNFEAPLTVAMSIILTPGDVEQDLMPGLHDIRGDFSKADIVFITDGQAGLTEAWVEQFNHMREQAHIHTHGIVIGTGTETLEPFCDAVVTVSDLVNDNALDQAQEVFAEV